MVYFDQIHFLDTGMQNGDDALQSINLVSSGQLVKMLINLKPQNSLLKV